MTRKTGWEDSSTGPDWIDVETLMRAIQGLHSGHVALVLSPSGTGSSGGVSVAASMLFDVLPGSSLPKTVVVEHPWPCAEHRRLVDHCFSALYELDSAIGKTYENESLWK